MARYSLHSVSSPECNGIREDETLFEADTVDAAESGYKAALQAGEAEDAGPFGYAILDHETGLVDYGRGFGVDVEAEED